ncbi:nicotinamidase/pyrazinamidase [compost metagenome]
MKALIIVDVQNDFLPGGALAVEDGNEIISIINDLQTEYDLVVATQDWHPVDHKSFITAHPNNKLFDMIKLNGVDQKIWPVHCVQGTFGAELAADLSTIAVEAIFRKGMNKEVDSYSGFYENDKIRSTGLFGYLRERGVDEVEVCGLALDFCVYYTANDALNFGLKSGIIERASKPISVKGFELIKEDFLSQGGRII